MPPLPRQLSYFVLRAANRLHALSSRRGARGATILLPVVAFVVAVAAGAVSESSTDPDRSTARSTLVPRIPRAPTSADGVPEEEIEILEAVEPTPAPVPWIAETFPYVPPRVAAPRWVKHDVMPGERLDDIAERYGVERDKIAKWNGLSRKRPRLRAGQKLKIKAERFPAPRQHASYMVRPGDSWSSVATAFGLTPEQLRRANRRKSMVPGARLHVWADSAIPGWGTPPTSEPELVFNVPSGGVGVGLAYRGRLDHGVQLPESDLYTRRIPGHAYGTSRTIHLLQHGIASFRHSTGFDGEVLIGGISRPRGGKFPPHRSHRTGRDVDINLPAFPGFPEGTRARGGQVDWGATWALMRAFLDSGQVRYIFLSYRLQKHLYQAARLMGESDEELAHYIQWPRGSRSRHGVVRHSKGHIGHFHVRFVCGPNERRCLDP